MDKDVMYMLGQIDSNVKSIQAGMADQAKKIDENSKRVSVLEEARARQTGEMRILGIVWGAISSVGIAFAEWFLFKR